MTEPMRIGLVGCGTMGSSLARALAASEEAQLTTVYDTAPGAATELATRYRARVASSAEELLAHPGLDGVLIAVPPYLHVPLVIQAARAGVDVFVEKPMAVDVAGCRQMIAAAEEEGIRLMVGQVLRYYEPYRSILRWQAQGRFGRGFAASIWRVTNGAKWAVEGYWRASRAKSGGYILEVGAHELDMLRCLLGEPKTVCAVSQKVLPHKHEMDDFISLQIRFVRGGAATYEGGGGAGVGRYGFRLYYEGATLISDAAFDPKALHVYDMSGQRIESLASEFSPEHPVQAELSDWLSALRGEAPVPIPGAEGLATVALAEAAYRSAETGRIVAYSTDT